MNKIFPTLFTAAAVAVVCVVAPVDSLADEQSELQFPAAAATDSGASSMQRYQAAIDEAGQALRRNLARCEKLALGERGECVREANVQHDSEMTMAGDVLRRLR